jgi:hypothetical protein
MLHRGEAVHPAKISRLQHHTFNASHTHLTDTRTALLLSNHTTNPNRHVYDPHPHHNVRARPRPSHLTPTRTRNLAPATHPPRAIFAQQFNADNPRRRSARIQDHFPDAIHPRRRQIPPAKTVPSSDARQAPDEAEIVGRSTESSPL